jgi:ubiquinone/menaquinone biosynthesis C-methylase UbiE
MEVVTVIALMARGRDDVHREQGTHRSFPAIKSARSFEEEDQWIADAMRAVANRAGRPIRVLEAGCGNKWPIDLQGVDYHLTGADLDAAALKVRMDRENDLDEVIHGDLCTMTLTEASFDVVYSAFVLEHISAADSALGNMVRALKPHGLLVVRVPEPNTARGFVTRNTPFWFHVLYHRWVMKRETAGKPGYAPYRTYYHAVISLKGMQAYAQASGLRCQAVFADKYDREGKGIAGVLFRTGARLIDALSLGRITSQYSNLVYLLEKQQGSFD